MEDSISQAAEAGEAGVCKQNLLDHISHVQDGIDDRLSVIERQVTGMLLSFLNRLSGYRVCSA